MAKPEPEVRVTFDMGPPAISAAAIAASKAMLEVWLNADSRRDIRVKERCTSDGTEIYLELVGELDDT